MRHFDVNGKTDCWPGKSIVPHEAHYALRPLVDVTLMVVCGVAQKEGVANDLIVANVVSLRGLTYNCGRSSA